MGTEQTKPDEYEVARILSALDERKNPYETWEFAGLLYTGIRVVGDRIAIKKILKLDDDVTKMEYWRTKLDNWRTKVDKGECDVVKWPSSQYKNRYKVVDGRNRIELLLVEHRYGEVMPVWIMPTE